MFLKLSGNVSYRIWTGSGCCFDLKPILSRNTRSLRKFDFWPQKFEKTTIFSIWPTGGKNDFWTPKSIFFKVPQTFRRCFLPNLNRLGDVVSTSNPFYRSIRRFWENSIFDLKKWPFSVYGLPGIKTDFFLSPKSIFSRSEIDFSQNQRMVR